MFVKIVLILLSINLHGILKTIRNDPLQSALTQGTYTSTGADAGAGCVHTVRRGGGTDPACASVDPACTGVDPARRVRGADAACGGIDVARRGRVH